MKKSVYQKQLEEILQNEKSQENHLEQSESNQPGHKKTLLLHACCAPCSSYVLEYLTDYFDITILYYNPNIYPQEEYERRLKELVDFLPRFEPAVKNKIKLVQTDYIPQEFYNAVKTDLQPELAKENERGERCRRCYELRIKKAYDYAVSNNFDYFCTTLSISPFKDAEKINVIGENLCKNESLQNNFLQTDSSQTSKTSKTSQTSKSPKWLPSDFKKNSGFLRSLELSKEYGLYRQQYCGCVFSKENTENFRNSLNKNQKIDITK